MLCRKQSQGQVVYAEAVHHGKAETTQRESNWIREDINGGGIITAELRGGTGMSPRAVRLGPVEAQFKRTVAPGLVRAGLACETKASTKSAG